MHTRVGRDGLGRMDVGSVDVDFGCSDDKDGGTRGKINWPCGTALLLGVFVSGVERVGRIWGGVEGNG